MEPTVYYYAIGFCLLCAGAYWLLRESGDPARPIDSITGGYLEPQPQSRRQELVEARAKFQRQLETMQSPAHRHDSDAAPYAEYEVAEQRALLDGIDQELSSLQAGPAQRRREELKEARDAILYQIDILENPVGRGSKFAHPPNVGRELAKLQDLLDGIDQELAELRS
jgi:hypothetical protein